jgi:putative two-component system response regulator
MGAAILSGSSAKVLQVAEEIALAHHERWDGTGYAGLAGEAIPLRARIVSVCDVYDALISLRPYKQPWPVEAAVAEIDRQRDHHFDPRVVEAFFDIMATPQTPVDGPAAG